MPIYEHKCKKCKAISEVIVPMNQANNDMTCPDCGGPTIRLISKTSFALKGDGWAKDGYSKGSSNG